MFCYIDSNNALKIKCWKWCHFFSLCVFMCVYKTCTIIVIVITLRCRDADKQASAAVQTAKSCRNATQICISAGSTGPRSASCCSVWASDVWCRGRCCCISRPVLSAGKYPVVFNQDKYNVLSMRIETWAWAPFGPQGYTYSYDLFTGQMSCKVTTPVFC